MYDLLSVIMSVLSVPSSTLCSFAQFKLGITSSLFLISRLYWSLHGHKVEAAHGMGSPDWPSANKRTKAQVDETVGLHRCTGNCDCDPRISDKVNNIAWSSLPSS
jgi:hypothetical protein